MAIRKLHYRDSANKLHLEVYRAKNCDHKIKISAKSISTGSFGGWQLSTEDIYQRSLRELGSGMREMLSAGVRLRRRLELRTIMAEEAADGLAKRLGIKKE